MARKSKNGWKDLDKQVAMMANDMVKEVKDFAAGVALGELTDPYQEGGATPVKTGNLLANTVVSLTPYMGTTEERDQSGNSTFAAGSAVIMSAKTYQPIYIQNNTEYNRQAEYDGWGVTPAYRYFSKAMMVMELQVKRKF